MPTRLLLAACALACTLPLVACNRGADGAGAADATLTSDVEKPGADGATPQAASAPATPAGDSDNRNENGSLAAGDATLTSGEFADTYTVDVDAGQTVTVDMRTSAFDPYVILRAPDGTQVDNDDYEGDRTRAHIEHVATQSGAYSALATSFAVGEQGPYTLTVQMTAGPPPAPAPAAGAVPGAAPSAGGK